MAQRKTTCLTCRNKPVARGLCSTCRAAAKAAIDRGEVTEQQLIDSGLLLPAMNAGRKPNNGFVRQLQRVRK